MFLIIRNHEIGCFVIPLTANKLQANRKVVQYL